MVIGWLLVYGFGHLPDFCSKQDIVCIKGCDSENCTSIVSTLDVDGSGFCAEIIRQII